MKIKPIFYSLALLMSSVNAMKDWQKAPGQPLGGAGKQSSLVLPTKRPSSPPRRPLPPTPPLPVSAVQTAPKTRPENASAVAQEKAQIDQQIDGEGRRKLQEQQQRRQDIRAAYCSIGSSEDVLIASHESEYFPYILSRRAVSISPVLQNYVHFEEQKNPGERPLLILENSFEQSRFIGQVLSFLKPLYESLFVLQEKLEQERVVRDRALIEQTIKEKKQEILTQVAAHIIPIVMRADISFVEAVELTHFFDLPIVFDALVHIQKPMPAPQTAEEMQNYNEQLVGLFSLAQGVEDNRLWRLLGRMLYPCHAQCPIEIEGIIQFLEAHRDLEQVVLGSYMAQNPQAYRHPLAILPTTDDPTSIVYSPDGSLLATASSFDGTISLWNTQTNRLIIKKELDQRYGISHIAFSPDGMTLAVIFDAHVVFFDSHTLAEKPVPDGIINASGLAFNPTSQTIAVCTNVDDDCIVRIYDLRHNAEINSYIIHGTGYVYNVRYSPDGSNLVVVEAPFNDSLLTLPSKNDRPKLSLDKPHIINLITNNITVIPEICFFAVFSNDNKILITDRYVWDLTTNALISRRLEYGLERHVKRACAVHPQSNLTALFRYRNVIHLFDINEPEDVADTIITPTSNERASVNDLVFHPQGTVLAVALSDRQDEGRNNIRLFGHRSLRQALLAPRAIHHAAEASAASPAPAMPSIAAASHQPPIAPLPLGQVTRGPAEIAAQEQEDDEPVILVDQHFDQVVRPTIAEDQQATIVPSASAPAQTGAAKVSAAQAPAVAPTRRGGLLNTLWEKGRDWWKGGKKE